MDQWERISHVSLPPPTMIRDLSSNLDQSLYEPFCRSCNVLAHKVELPKKVQEIVGQEIHEQPSLVRREATAARLVPTQRVLPKMAVEGYLLLLLVRQVFRGISVHDQALPLLSPHESIVGPHEGIFECF
jgi:hypothetical protein